MNPTSGTLKFVGVAAVSALLAFGAWKASQPSPVAGYGDVGQPFFPDFDDVTKASALTVVDYDGDEKDVMTFSVRQNDDGLWVIPSHHDYPAEAEDRLARTATSLLGVKKTAVKSRSKDDWKRFGVVDPSEDGAATAEERGTRLTLSDGSGNPLVDLIVGNEIEGQEKQYHVREPEKNTTYIAQLDVDLSAKFSDWIEPDLLKISSGDIVKITLDNYSINEERGTVEKKELLEFAKEDLKTSGDWKLAGLNDETEELDNSPISSIATNLDQLKIVGVRPKPEGLDDNLRINPAVKQILQMQMQAQGYFIGGGSDGKERLYSNEGELIAGVDSGVEYTLYFGEIARGSGKDIEVGLADEEASKEEKEDGEEEADEDGEDGPRRYLLVKVDFNEALLGQKPEAPVEPVKPDILKEVKQKEEEKKEEEKKEDAAEKEATDAGKEESADEKENTDEDDACGPEDEGDSGESQEGDSGSESAADSDEPPPKESTEEKTDGGDVSEKTEPPASADDKSTAESANKADTATESKPAKNEDADKKSADADKGTAEAKKEEPGKEEVKTEEPAKEEPKEPEKDPKQVAQEQYDAAVKAYESEKKTYESDLKEYEDKVKEGQEKADELALRFSGWYYVISSDSFEKFRIERKDVVSKKEEKTEDEAKDDSK